MTNHMEQGKWYRIRHRGTHQRYDRKSEMQYLGVVEGSIDTGNVRHQFNARPTAGTQWLDESEIISTEEIPKPHHPFVSARW